jgi:DNA-binding NarL/FixJ family response regulator
MAAQRSPGFPSSPVMAIPTYIFKDRSIAVLEALVAHLKERGMKNSEIARLINRDERTIATVTYRLQQKRQR